MSSNTSSYAINIPTKLPGGAYKLSPTETHSELKQNSFNPSKDSPPNFFLEKLTHRYNRYYKSDSLLVKDNHDETK